MKCIISGCLPWETNCLLTICRQSQLAGKTAENEMDSWENKHSGEWECRMDGLLKYSDSNEETDWERSLKKSFNPKRKEILLQKRSLFFSTELIVSVQPARSLNPLLKGHNNPLHFTSIFNLQIRSWIPALLHHKRTLSYDYEVQPETPSINPRWIILQ